MSEDARAAAFADALAAAQRVYARFHAGDLEAVRGPAVAAQARELLALSSVETPDGPAVAIPGLQGAAVLFWSRCVAAERSGQAPDHEDEASLWALVDALTEVDPALVPFAVPPRRPVGHWQLFDAGRQALGQATATYPFDQDGVRGAADLMRQAVELSEGTPDHPVVLGSFGATMIDLYQCGGERQDIEAAVTAVRAALNTLSPAHEMYPALRASLGGALVRRYEESRDPADLDDAEAVLRAVLADQPPGLDLTPVHADLASVLNARVLRPGGSLADVEAALAAVRQAVARMPAGHPSYAGFALMLARLLDRRGVGLAEVAETVDAFRAGLTPESVARRRHTEPDVLASDLLALAGALMVRIDPTDGLPPEAARDLDECVELASSAAELVPDRPQALASLGLALRIRWARATGRRAGDAAAVSRGIRAPERAPRGDPDSDLRSDLRAALDVLTTAMARGGGPDVAILLGGTWWYHYDSTGAPADLDRAIDTLRHAVPGLPDDHPDKPAALVVYGQALAERFRLAGDRPDVDTAVEVYRRAADGAEPGSVTWCDATRGYAGARAARFDHSHDPADVDAAIEAGNAVLAATTDEDRGAVLWRLGTGYWRRYSLAADLADANTAVDLLRDALDVLPFDDEERGSAVTALGNTLAARGQHLGSSADILEAARCFQAAVALEPAGPRRQQSRLSLGKAVSQLAMTSHQADHFDLAESMFRDLLAEDTDQHVRVSAIVGLGSLVSVRGGLTGNTEQVSESVALLRSALAAAPLDAALNLANALKLRYGRRRDQADLDEAIGVLTALAPDQPAPARAVLTLHLGDLWSLRAAPGDHDRAYRAYLEVATGGVILASYRVFAARSAAGIAARGGRWDDALEAYTVAVELLPLIAWRGLARADQQRLLADFAGLAGEAAAAALSAGRPETAVELLEHGRAVLWTQVLQTRGDPAYGSLDGLEPRLAEELAGVRAAMAAPAVAPPGLPAELAAAHARMVHAHREQELLGRVRAQPGFENFLRRKGFTELSVAAAGGPVVLVNLTARRRDALVVTSSGVRVVELAVSFAEVAERAGELLSLRPGAGLGSFVDAQAALVDLLAWLWDAVVAPVLAVVPDESRVWWCPAGVASVFPLHAAGRYAAAPRVSAMDRVVSSYTTTLTALTRARRRPAASGAARLVVGVADAPGLPHLANVATEVGAVAAGPGATTLVGADATADRVLTALAGHPWAHIACHGRQDVVDPSGSYLAMCDRPLTVVEIAALDLPAAEFAFLSACETAGAGRLPDEAISVAAALQLAGYRHVIATLWPVPDRSAVAAGVYRAGTTPPEPASALHEAIRAAMAAHPYEPTAWAAYQHLGP